MKYLKLMIVLCSSSVLAACSATPEECDPSVELNVFSKAACQFSGSYQQRVDQRETTLKEESKTTDELNEAYVDVKNQQVATQRKVSKKSVQLSNINKSVSANKSTIAQKKHDVTQLNQQIAEIKKQIENVKANPSLSSVEKEKELQRLQTILSTREAAAAAAAGF